MIFKPMEFYDEKWVLITNEIVPNITENKYIVSNYGFISNVDYNQHHKVYSPKFGGPFHNRLYINLTDKDGKGLLAIIARIVAKAFCPGYAPGLEVNHIDGNPSNNYYKNLEWVNRSENIRHAYDNNLITSLVDENIVRQICMYLEQDILSAEEISEITGLNKISKNPISLISAIKKKIIWQHISKDYNIPQGRHGRLFTDDQIERICSMLEFDISMNAATILNTLGIVPKDTTEYHKFSSTISAIRYRRKYTNISSNYSF